jgi:hypothetical protein
MASLRGFQLTLTGAAQNLGSAALAALGTNGGSFRFSPNASIKNKAANATVYVGDLASLTGANDCINELAAGETFSLSGAGTGPVDLDRIWVLGTNTQKIYVILLL